MVVVVVVVVGKYAFCNIVVICIGLSWWLKLLIGGEMVDNLSVVRLHELQLLSQAAYYDLWNGDGRKQSAHALVDLFFGIVRILQPHSFIEAGAKTGETSLRARSLCPDARVVAFEANPYNYSRYAEQFRHDEKSVEYVHSALAAEPGQITFNIISKRDGVEVTPYTGQNSILERVSTGVEYESVTVPATTLDSYFTDAGRTAMWVDVEGASKQVVAGGERLLATTDVMLIELEDEPKWKEQWNSTEALVHLFGHGLTPVARDFEYRTQHNVLLLSDRAMADSEVLVNLEYYFSVLTRRR